MKRGQQVLDSNYSEFSATDPFNPQNHVEGQVSFSRDRHYGSLKIKKINGESVNEPRIFGTPKIAYPFGLGHNYRFPSAERKIAASTGRIEQMFNIAKRVSDTRKKIWELMVRHAFDSNTDTATVFHKIANQFDQDKRLIYKTIKNVQKMMKIEEE